MTWCFDCKKDKKGDELALCKDKKHDTDDDHLFQPNTLRTRSEKKKVKELSLEKKIKGRIGDNFVESIIRDGTPLFLCNVDGEIQLSERIEYDGITYIPLDKNECGYKPYEFTKLELNLLKNNPPTKQQLLEKSWKLTNHFIDTTEINKTLIAVDLVLSYCQEWVDSLHFPYFVGETESGKSSALYLFKWSGYRTLYSNDIPHADIYNFLGTGEESCGTICEDEAQDLKFYKEKIRTYKNSYCKGSYKPIINTTSNTKTQVYYKTFCLKLFAGERVPDDKGFKERLAIVHMVEGFPKGNAKKPTPEEKEQLKNLRNQLLFWKVLHIDDGLADVEHDLKNRDQELWEDFLKVAKDTEFEDRSLQVVDYYSKQRHEGIWDSLDSRLFKLVLNHLGGKFTLKMEGFWSYLTLEQDEIQGDLEYQTFFTFEFSKKITRNYLSNLFSDKFQAKKKSRYETIDGKKHMITEYIFSELIIKRLSHKYNVKGGASGTSGKLDAYESDHVDHLDHVIEVS